MHRLRQTTTTTTKWVAIFWLVVGPSGWLSSGWWWNQVGGYLLVGGETKWVAIFWLIFCIRDYMCVNATKGTYRRDIKMIVNHDYIYYYIYIIIIYILCMHLYTSTHQFRLFCECMFLVPYFLPNTIRSGRAFKAAPPKFCYHTFNSGATLLCVGDFSHKIVLHRAAKKNFD